MSGEDAISMLGGTNNNNTAAPAPTTTTATYPPPPTVTDDSESTSSSWRLDTTRKLTAVSISHGRKDDAMIFHLHNSLLIAMHTNEHTPNQINTQQTIDSILKFTGRNG